MENLSYILIGIAIFVTIILSVVGFFLIRTLIALRKTLLNFNAIFETSELELKDVLKQVLSEILARAEINEEIIESIVHRGAPGSKRLGKKREKRNLFKGV